MEIYSWQGKSSRLRFQGHQHLPAPEASPVVDRTTVAHPRSKFMAESEFSIRLRSSYRRALSLVVATDQHHYHWEMIYRYSSLQKLLRVTAICFRVSQIIEKMPQSTLYYPLTPQDINQARVYWIKATQAAYVATELKLISQLNCHQLIPSIV